MKNLNKIIGYTSIPIGLFMIYHFSSILIDYIQHPNLLRCMIPYHNLIIRIIFGILITTGGLLLINKNRLFQYFYLSIGYFYFVLPFTELIDRIIRYDYGMDRINYFLIFFTFYFAISLPLLIYFNLKGLLKIYDIKPSYKKNLVLLIISIFVNSILNICYGGFSML